MSRATNANPLKQFPIPMKAPLSTKNTDPVLNALTAKLRLKRHKVERLRGTLRHLEAECERLEMEIRKHQS